MVLTTGRVLWDYFWYLFILTIIYCKIVQQRLDLQIDCIKVIEIIAVWVIDFKWSICI